MAFIEYSDGLISRWDETITVGELITTYNDGYHVLTRIEFRERSVNVSIFDIVARSHTEYECTPLFHYVKVLKGDGTPSKRITSQCDAVYCQRVTKEQAKEAMLKAIKAEEQKFQAILKYLPKD